MNPYIIVLTCRSLEAEEKAMSALNSLVERCVVKTKSVSSQGTEITAEIRLKNADTEFVHRLYELDGVENAVLVSYNGDYMS